jgi:uncharacterized protein (TIGR03067 family)
LSPVAPPCYTGNFSAGGILVAFVSEVLMRVCIVLLVGLALIQVPVSPAADEQSKGLDQLRGSWEVVDTSEPAFQAKRFMFDGDKLTIVLPETKNEAKVKVDSTAKPMQIDIIAKTETSPGIYELREDTLRICFATKAGSGPPSSRPDRA